MATIRTAALVITFLACAASGALAASEDLPAYFAQTSTSLVQADSEAVRRIMAGREQILARVEALRAARSGGSYAVTALKSLRIPPPTHMRLAKTQGGLVRRLDQAAVAVPPAALAQDIEIAITHPAAQPARETTATERKLAPASLPVAFGPEGAAFSAPVTITIAYDPALVASQGLRASDLKVHHWNHILQAWEALPSRVDASEHLVSAEVRHFSVYQVLGSGGSGIGVAAAETALGFQAAYVFPNPVRGQNMATIRVQPGQTDSVEVHVYDLSGRRVHSSSSFSSLGAFDDGNGLGAQFTYDHVWDVSGVGSGVYRYVVTAKKAGQADIVKSGKVAVVK